MRSLPVFFPFLVFIFLFLFPTNRILIHAIPVIPGAQGFGSHTVAGSGRHLSQLSLVNTTIYRISTLNWDSTEGSGSLRECIDAVGPRVCVFEISGCIRVMDYVRIRNPYLTIAGQTAPEPGICLYGAIVSPRTHDVLIQHVFIRTGDSPEIPVIGDGRDSMDCVSGAFNVFVDHISCAYAIDETWTLWMTEPQEWIYNVTLSNSFLTHSLHDSIHTKGPHGKGILLGPGSKDITLFQNLLAHHWDRNPLMGGGNSIPDTPGPSNVEMVNNLMYNFRAGTVINHNYISNSSVPQFAHIVANYWLEGPNTSSTLSYYVRLYRMEVNESRVWVSDSYGKLTLEAEDEWDFVRATGNLAPPENFRADGPIFEPQVERRMAAGPGLMDYILANAGARPLQRDYEDSRVVGDIEVRGGSVINCISHDGSERCLQNAGGEPVFAVNHRHLDIPADYWEVLDRGYTRLEEWLFGFSRDLEDFSCAGLHKDDSDVCSNRGVCMAQDFCWCVGDGIFSGSDCEDFYLSDAVLATIGIILSFVFVIPLVLVLVFVVVGLVTNWAYCCRKGELDDASAKLDAPAKGIVNSE